MQEPTRISPILGLVAAARVGVGAAMLLAPGRFFKPESGTETLLMFSGPVAIRDLFPGTFGYRLRHAALSGIKP